MSKCIDFASTPPQPQSRCNLPALALAYRAFVTDIEEWTKYEKWQCIVCGWIYDEAEGYEDEGIAPGTGWDAVDEDFVCPECGVGKADFEMIEIG